MITIVIALVIVLAVAFVAFPLFKSPDELDVSFVGLTDPVLENLIVQRDATYSAIKDLENDHTLGKLSDGDYRSLRAKYETKAVTILQELDSLTRSKQNNGALSREQALEEEIGRLRRAASGESKCVKCGTPHAPEDVFCAKCGASLRGARCPACGRRAAIGDKFCGKCGSAI